MKIIDFDYEGFADGIKSWHSDVKNDLKEESDFRLNIIDQVLDTVEEMLYDSAEFEEDYIMNASDDELLKELQRRLK